MSALDESPAAEGRYRVLFDALPIAVYQTGADGSCVLVNERWRELSGLSAAEAAGHGWASAIHPADRDRVQAAFTATRSVPGPYEIDFRIMIGPDIRWISADWRLLIWPMFWRSSPIRC